MASADDMPDNEGRENMKHEGNLIITKDNAEDFAEITSVGGYLSVEADAQLPALTSVGGNLYVRADAQLPALTSVGGYLYVEADAQLPALTSVGGYLSVRADGKLSAPLLAFNGEKYTEIARSGYALFAGDKGTFRAGCRGPFMAEQALAHWHRSDVRAVVFTAAIKKHIGA